MDKEFRKFATRHMGINSMALDDVVSMQNQYLNPYILEDLQPSDDGPHHLPWHRD